MDEFENQNSEVPDIKIEEQKQKKVRKVKPKPIEEKPPILFDESELEPELLGPIDDDEIVNLTNVPKIKVKPKLIKPKKQKVTETQEPETFENPIDTPEIKEEKSIEVKPNVAKPRIHKEEIKSEIIESKTEEIKKEAGVVPGTQPEPVPEPVNFQPEQPKPEQPVKKADFSLMKWFAAGIAIAAVLMVALFFMTLHNVSSYFPDNPDAPTTTGLAVYEPTNLLEGWQLNESRVNLAEIPSDIRADWIKKGIKDAAMWHYTKGAEDLYFWLRIYPDKETLDKDKDFTSMFAWASVTNLGIGDKAIIGGYKASEENIPLMVYVAKDAKMFYIAYYNENGFYNTTNMPADQHFLVGLARDMLAKLDGGVQQSLNNSKVNTAE